MNASNSELLAELLDVVSRLSAVSPEGVRAELLAPQSGGLSLFDQIRSRHASRPSDVNSGGWQPAHVGALRGQAQE